MSSMLGTNVSLTAWQIMANVDTCVNRTLIVNSGHMQLRILHNVALLNLIEPKLPNQEQFLGQKNVIHL